jgi:uncharacterized protein YigA (DUF484 family)
MSTPEMPAQYVADHLVANPDFFNEYPELLARLRIPHVSGQAVSLVERQMQVLRDKVEQLEEEKAGLIEIARSNVEVSDRIQDLTLALIGADTFDELVTALQDMLYDHFQVEAVELRLLSHAELEQLADAEPARKRIADIFHAGEPVSGRFAQVTTAEVFGPQAGTIQSSAIVPLLNSASYGLLAIGSQDPERFTPDKGNLFLRYLAQVLNQCLRRLALPGA